MSFSFAMTYILGTTPHSALNLPEHTWPQSPLFSNALLLAQFIASDITTVMNKLTPPIWLGENILEATCFS